MTKEEIKQEVDKMTEIEPIYMMGTKAFHQLGELSRELDLFITSHETEKYYIGNWVTGFGFFHVCFPKKTSRRLTPKEIKKYNKTYVQISSQPAYKLNVE